MSSGMYFECIFVLLLDRTRERIILVPAFSIAELLLTVGTVSYRQALTAIFTMLGLAAYPGLFALYPTAERLREVRTMQYGNGVTPSALWSAYAMFDFIFVLIVCIFAVAIWSTQYAGW